MVKHSIKKLSAFNVIGVALNVQNPASAIKQISSFWQEFVNNRTQDKIPNKRKPEQTIAVYTNYTNALLGGYALILGAIVEHTVTVPPSMVAITIPDQTYAVISIKENIPESIAQTWQTIWKTPFERTFTFDFELYHDEKNEWSDKASGDIYIALKPDWSQAA